MMAKAIRWGSIDGALFDLERGEWAAALPRPAGGSGISEAREGLVAVDGAWFDLLSGEWAPGPRRTTGSGVSVVPEGFVSVDGALLPVEPS
jgi:hypothetical protein